MLKIPNYPLIKSASIQSLQFNSGNKPMAMFAIVGQEEEEVGDKRNEEYPSKTMPSKFLLYHQSV
jgi:hypothetical protein